MKKIVFDPLTVIVWLWLIVVEGIVCAIGYLFAIVIHELGHFVVAKKTGYNISRFAISPFGFEISFFNQNIEQRDELRIALAGPLANLLTSTFVISLWWMFPTVYFFTWGFVFASVALSLVNLLPAYPLDGGRIFISFFSRWMEKEKAKKITIVLNVTLSILFFALFVFFSFFNFNPTYLLFSIFLVGGSLDLWRGSEFEKINIFSKKFKNFSKPNFVVVDENVPLKNLLKRIENSKTIVFCLVLENGKIVNLSEKFILNLSLNFDINKNIGEIIKK